MKKRDHREEILSRFFGSIARPRILSLLIGNPRKEYYQREIMFETGLSLQAVQRELENLFELGILRRRETRVRVYYQAEAASSWFKPLQEILGA
jgi:DNA-binding Lrp family transcriptional regulator